MKGALLLSLWILIAIFVVDVMADADAKGAAAQACSCAVCPTFEQLHKEHDAKIRADRDAVAAKRREAVKLWWEDLTGGAP
jgi:hypothetical protein